MTVLECSTRGCELGKKFSAFIAKVHYNGKIASIEEHYQSAKRFDGVQLDKKLAKGKHPTSVVIYNKEYSPSSLTAFYYLLWYKYYEENPELVNLARTYTEYRDMFKGKSINCQADTLRMYIRNKSNYHEIITPLLKELGYSL